MQMRIRIVLFLIAILVASTGLSCSGKVEQAEPEKKKDVLAGTIQWLKIDNILTTQLAGGVQIRLVRPRTAAPQ